MPETTVHPGEPCTIMFVASVTHKQRDIEIACEGFLTPLSAFGVTPLAAVEYLASSLNEYASKGGKVRYTFSGERTPLPTSIELDDSIRHALK